MEWLNNLSNAIEYIENNLDKEISYEEAARIACCSTYYFQRMFSYVAGIPLSNYIRRRRMTQAAFELQRTDKKVIDIALKYGYTSPTSFNRAFQNVHGIAPAAARNMGITLNAYPPIKFSVKVTGGSAMSYYIAEKESMRIVGIRTPLVEDMEENQKSVPVFWNNTLQGQQFSAICQLSNQEPQGILGVSIYQSPKDIFYYIAAATDKSIPTGMYGYEIPAATWVVFENDGRFKENVQSVFQRFYIEWLPFSGYEYAGLPDIEVYPIYEKKTLNGHSEVWIAVKKKRRVDL
ncbi:AraC family transcriptional regulator [Tissierella carlieri]|uniref:AraC family transcriptional regulator n=1 Tax=Tissierella carlieri TaxID=689904 RepID=A0ABT1SCW2_9FIRM|nr:AraC family transcriptional regulator [Tissierella carlieri]MCQ4924324.1 AraC family transcriptional regulator [Tissierella carlieri]